MHQISLNALVEHLEAALMVAPATTLESFNSPERRKRHRAVEWLADHLSLRLRHHNIALVDAGLEALDKHDDDHGVATELQDDAPELANWERVAGVE